MAVVFENDSTLNIATDDTMGSTSDLIAAGKTTTGASVLLTKGNLKVPIFVTGEVIEDYENPAFIFTPGQSTSNQTGTSVDSNAPLVVNLLMVSDTFDVDGYIDGANRDTLRLLAHAGADKSVPTHFLFDNLDVVGVITRCKIHKPANQENSEWPVEITFKKANST